MKKRKYGFKIAYKIFIFTTVISFIPMIIINTVFYNKIRQTVEDEVVASYQHLIQQYVSNVEYKLALYDNIMGEISSNNLVQDFLTFLQQVKNPDEVREARVTLLEDVNKYLSDKFVAGLNELTLYPLGNRAVLYHSHIGNVDRLDDRSWIQSMLDTGNKTNFYVRRDWADRKVISFYAVIRDTDRYAPDNILGLARLDTFVSNFFALTNIPAVSENVNLAIVDQNRDPLYGTGDLYDWKNKKEMIENAWSHGENHVEIDGREYRILNQKIARYGWSVLLLFDYGAIRQQVREATMSIFIMSLTLYIILFMICILFSASVSARLKVLTDKMEKVKSGAFATQPVVTGRDEIAEIDHDFNNMIVRLHKLINENYVQNIERKEAELRALRFQINPHFLYNTLELINSMASVYGCDDIGKISQNLGQMFRYNMSGSDSDFATLREEIEHIQNYTSIEKVRFEDKIKVKIEVSQDLLECRVPRFILQPLVENAFRHGFRDKTDGCVVIHAERKDSYLCILVQDNGQGIAKERLDDINRSIHSQETGIASARTDTGIGLYNINRRIQLCCGEAYGIQMKSQEGKGTEVWIRLPAE